MVSSKLGTREDNVFYSRSGSYNRGAVDGPRSVPDYMSTGFSVQRTMPAEGTGARDPRLSLTCITGTDQIV